MATDQKQLEVLNRQSNTSEKWEALSNAINERQIKINNLSPLSSEDGSYTAHLPIIDIDALVLKSGTEASQLLLSESENLLASAKELNDKLSARKTYGKLLKLEEFNPYFKKSRAGKKKEALDLGTKHILVGFDETALSYVEQEQLEAILTSLDLEEGLWTKFVLFSEENVEIDELMKISIDELSYGQEQVKVNEESHTIRTNYNNNPRTAQRDSLGRVAVAQQNNFNEDRVFYATTSRSKISYLHGAITLSDFSDGRTIDVKKIKIENSYVDDNLSSAELRNRLGVSFSKESSNASSNLPTDSDVMVEFSRDIISEVKKFSKDIIQIEDSNLD